MPDAGPLLLFHSQDSVALPSVGEHRQPPEALKTARGVPSWKLQKPMPSLNEARPSLRGRSS